MSPGVVGGRRNPLPSGWGGSRWGGHLATVFEHTLTLAGGIPAEDPGIAPALKNPDRAAKGHSPGGEFTSTKEALRNTAAPAPAKFPRFVLIKKRAALTGLAQRRKRRPRTEGSQV